MNLYFWSFALYALLIAPVNAHIQLLIDKGFHYCIELHALGMPLIIRTSDNKSEKKTPAAEHSFVQALLSKNQLKRLISTFEWKRFKVDARISFEDAAQTALVYSMVRTCLFTAERCGLSRFDGHICMDFNGKGTALSLSCIASARLGRIGIAAIRLRLAAAAQRRRQRMKEEGYAASH